MRGGVRLLAGVCILLSSVYSSPEARADCRGQSAPHTEQVETVSWVRERDPAERMTLDRWCAAVGSPAIVEAKNAEPQALERLVIVSWNVHVGGGGLRALIRDLSAGRLTQGGPVSDFVILVQEALRMGDAVPESPPESSSSASRIFESPPDGPRVGIDDLARAEGLFAFYAPSMRNGAEVQEDRGNAILSTLPMAELTVIELPVERQRRVALAATLHGIDRHRRPWRLRVANVHLDNWSRASRIFHSFGRGRVRQLRRVIDATSHEPIVALGGDLNSWFGEFREPAVELLREQFPIPVEPPPGPTHAAFRGLADRRVDHLAFRLPDDWTARYHLLEDKRGSDHRPLIGVLTIRADPVGKRVP